MSSEGRWDMQNHNELEHQHLLTVIETAHRDGKSEAEIVELVDPAFARERARGERQRLLVRLIGWADAREAA
jgi:hypothetical protein